MTVIRTIDFETTGFDASAQVCEVGICDLELEARNILPPSSWLHAVTEMPPEVRAVHHISMEDCAPFMPFDPSLFLEDPIDALAAHNAAFELQYFKTAIPVICTYKAALRVWPDAPGHSNGALRYWLQDQGLIALDHALTQPAHRAGPDAYVTVHILMALFDAGHTGRARLRQLIA